MLIEISEEDYLKINEFEIAVKAETIQDAIIKAIEEAKGVISRVEGHWIRTVTREEGDVTLCSLCGKNNMEYFGTPFCPYCGSPMKKINTH